MVYHTPSQVNLSQMEQEHLLRGFYKPEVPRPHVQEGTLRVTTCL